MNGKSVSPELPRAAHLRQIRVSWSGALAGVRESSRRLLLLYVGAWASLFDAGNNLVGAGRRLLEDAEQRGEVIEGDVVAHFRQLERKTLGQLRQLQDGIHLNEARTSLDNTFEQTQDELAERVQSVLDNLGIPSREQLARLNREIDQLNTKIDHELQRRAVLA